ncbi:MAG: proline--tRNA ligase, partial [Planctomycetota bacterium]
AYLPLGLRTLNKAIEMLRREMDAAGAVELAMPALTPISLWEQTGRADAFGDERIELTLHRQNRKSRLVLAPAHEEVVTDLVGRHLSSYRQLPLTLYQVRTKFRNEPRPRFGLLRTCEFLTSDAYSFEPSPEALDKRYQSLSAAYRRIFDRLGLDYLVAEAESGPTGGEESHEFVVPAEIGEDVVAHCRECGYAANLERAEVGPLGVGLPEVPQEAVRQVDTPGATTIDEVAAMLGCRPAEMIKTLIYTSDDGPIAVLIRGDREANEAKIRRALGTSNLELAPPGVIEKVTGAPVGFAGPVGLAERIPVWADGAVQHMQNAVTGANRADAHLTGVNPDRDFQVAGFADLRVVVDGDPCPRCSSTVALRRAVEVAHVFKLGTRYSEALGARFLDDHEQQHPIVMGSYQFGISRLIATVVETSHDARGIVWPVALAPYEVLLMPVNVTDAETMNVAQRLYEALAAAKIDVLLDDRDQRAGAKFYDADLIGVPLRVVIGPRGLKNRELEIKWRWEAEPEAIPLDTAVERISESIRREREDGARFKSGRASVAESP